MLGSRSCRDDDCSEWNTTATEALRANNAVGHDVFRGEPRASVNRQDKELKAAATSDRASGPTSFLLVLLPVASPGRIPGITKDMSGAMDQPHQDQPAFKRRRIALACTSCRNRKTRCNGAKPTCSVCIELGFDCIYEQPVRSSGNGARSSPGGYDDRLKAIEDMLQILVQRERPTASTPLNTSNILQPSHPDPPVAVPKDMVTLNPGTTEHSDEATVDGMVTVSDLDTAEGIFYGPSSNIAFIRDVAEATTTRLRALIPSENAGNAGEHPILSRATSPTPQLQKVVATPSDTINVRILPPAQDALRLIDMFFNDTGMLFPYVYKRDVLDAYRAATTDKSTGVSRPVLCLLNVIFAFATYISLHPGRVADEDANAAEVFFQRARQLARDYQASPANLTMLQAILLMCMYRQGTQGSDDTWQLHCHSFRSAMQLGLHSKTASQGLSPLQAEIRKRIWFGCVSFDRTLAMTFGRPFAIPESYINLDLPADCSLDALDDRFPSAASKHGYADTVCLFRSTILLYRILSDVLAQMYRHNLEPSYNINFADMLAPLASLEIRLNAFNLDLPPALKLQPWDTSESPGDTDSVFSKLSVIMRLRTLNVRLLLYRPVLARLLEHNSLLSTTVKNSHEQIFADLARASVRACQDCATEIVHITHTLRSRSSLLGAFWYASYYTFHAALAIFACMILELGGFPLAPHDGTSASFHAACLLSVHEQAKTLRKAIEAVETLGGSTRSARRIRRTLVKMMKTPLMLCQGREDITRVIVGVFGPSNVQSEGHAGETVGVGADFLLASELLSDSYEGLEIDGGQMWADFDFNVFGDMSGFEEVGFTAL